MPTIIEPEVSLADVQVPEYFATDVGLIEDAGGGNCRMIRCIKRRGLLWPVYSLVTPTEAMVKQSAAVHAQAQRILAQYRAATQVH